MVEVAVRRLSVVFVLPGILIIAFVLSFAPPQWAAAVPIAEPGVAPVVLSVEPASAPNDINLAITITGTDFTADLSDTLVLTAPIVALGDNVLSDVGWLTSTVMTATVPWNLTPGAYTLTITNPDGTVGSLPNAFTVQPGFNVWNSGGPYGGDLWHIVVNPLSPTQVLGVAGWSGLFASDDRAGQWRTSYVGAFPERPAIDAVDSRVIYVGTGDELARSDDGGLTWQQLSRTRYCADTVRPVTHPTLSGTVYLAVACVPGFDGGGGLYRSINRGATLTSITSGLTDTNVTALVFDPTDPNLMIAGTRAGNVFTSHTGGSSWTFAAHVAGHIERLVVNPFGAHEVWAVPAGYYADSPGLPYLFKSTNAAYTTWKSVFVTAQHVVWSVTFHPTISGTLYAGSGAGYVSTDGGAHWQPVGAGLPLGGGTSGFEAGVKDIAIDPQQLNRLYAATQQGVYASNDTGATWFKSDENLGGVLPMGLAVSHFDPQTAYAVTLGADILKTRNGGQTWQPTHLPWSGWSANLATDPFSVTRVYAGNNAEIMISDDAGETYHSVALQLPVTVTGNVVAANVIVPDPHHAGQLLAGVTIQLNGESFWRGAIYGSDDYGENWQWINVSQSISPVMSIVYHPIDWLTLYAGTGGGGLLKSSDGGATWQSLPTYGGAPIVTAVAVHPQNPRMVYVAGSGDLQGLWFSTDGGANWEYLSQQPTTGPVWSLAFAPVAPYPLYAGTMEDGLWRSLDGGQTWAVANGLAQGNIRSLATTSDGERAVVYVGVSSGAVSPTTQRVDTVSAVKVNTLLGSGIFRLSLRALNRQVYLPLLRR